MQCYPLEEFMWSTSCCYSTPWFLLFPCYPLLHLALVCYPRNSGPLQPLTTHDIAFSFLLGSRYWIWCISITSDPRYVIFGSIVVLWVSFPICHKSDPIWIIQERVMPNLSQCHNYGLFQYRELYGVECVTVSSFGSEIDREKTTFCALSSTFYRIPIRYS